MEEILEVPTGTAITSMYNGVIGLGRIELRIQKGEVLKCVPLGKKAASVLSKDYKEPCLTFLDSRFRRAYKDEVLKWVR